jgi:hypothetical protein
LERNTVNGIRGPWILLDGFIEQSAANDPRTVFTFLRGLLIGKDKVSRLRHTVETTPYLGNDGIPGPYDDHYTFAGEIPWSRHFGSGLRRRNGTIIRNIQKAFSRHVRYSPSFRQEIELAKVDRRR